MRLCKPGPLKEAKNVISWNWKIIFYKYKAHVMATRGGGGSSTTPPILNLWITWSWVGSSMPRLLELVRNVVAHGNARDGKWRGNWRMEWVASTLTPPPNVVLLKLMRTPRLPAVDWTDAPTDLNGLVRFGERRNLVSVRVPSCSAWAIPAFYI